jgi:hypothetical protein
MNADLTARAASAASSTSNSPDFDALAYDRLQNCHHSLHVRLDDRPVLPRGGDDQVVDKLGLEQRHLIVAVNGDQKLLDFLRGRDA